jgi:acetolactate decarboxylase
MRSRQSRSACPSWVEGWAGAAAATLLLLLAVPGWANAKAPEAEPRHVIVQTAPFESLARGGFEGKTPVRQLRQYGDFGIGTFNGLDGEMILLDGVSYQARASGGLRVAGPDELVPFATVTRFQVERQTDRLETLSDLADLQARLDLLTPDATRPMAIRVTGTFGRLKLRAPRKQKPPYPTLSEALKTQAEFNLTNARGTLVGFYFPSFIGGMNAPGYHFHFVSMDRRTGGHVLELAKAKVIVDTRSAERYTIEWLPNRDTAMPSVTLSESQLVDLPARTAAGPHDGIAEKTVEGHLEDTLQVLTLVLGHERVLPFLHLDQATKVPPMVGGVPASVRTRTLIIAGQLVRWSPATTPTDRMLSFLDLSFDSPTTAAVAFTHVDEGMEGYAALEKQDGVWRIVGVTVFGK